MSDYEPSELDRALARPDAVAMCRCLEVYADHIANDADGSWTHEQSHAVEDIFSCHNDDPEKKFAYVVLGASLADDPAYLAALGCGPLEDVLHDPSDALLNRIVAEARRSDRFRWLLSHPFKVAVAPRAWVAIEPFRSTGPHEEPPADTLPPRR